MSRGIRVTSIEVSTPEKVTRLVDVAARAGVSRATAAQVLNQSGGVSVRVGADTRARVLAIAKEMNYRPNRIAQQLKGIRSKTLGVILDTVNIPVMYQRLAALERRASARGFRLMIGQVHQDPEVMAAYLHDFGSRGIEGLVCLFDLIRGYEKTLQPLFADVSNVVFHGKAMVQGGMCVRVDGRQGSYMLARRLIERGCQRIGWEFWSPDDEMGDVRRSGYEQALREAGLALSERLLFYPEPRTQKPTPLGIEQALRHLVDREKCDAIMCSNDLWAVGLVQALKARGLSVPGDVAVTGYDNLDVSAIVDPAVTTIDQNHEAYAEAVLELIVNPGTRGSGVVTVVPELVVRQTA